MRLGLPARPGEPPLRVAMRFAWLVVLVVAIASNGGHPATKIPLLVVAGASWQSWSIAYAGNRTRLAAVFIFTLALSGGVLALWSSIAVGFLAAAAVAAGMTFDLRYAVPLTLAGPVALTISSYAHNWSRDLAIGGTAAALGGLVGGTSRRQAEQRAAQATRNELARELHDVLAHTLSALAVQLEAADAVAESGNMEKLRELIGRSRSLVTTGIEEASSAVRALRGQPVAIADWLADLVVEDRIPLRVEGMPRELPPQAGLALFRATQEALTNARKHAPGAPTAVSLAFRTGSTVVTVTNGHGESSTHAAGSGLGLQGMRERLELAGGSLAAAASGDGWKVEATVPG